MAVTLMVVTFTVGGSASAESINLGPDFSKFSDTNQADCSTNPFTTAPLSSPSCTWTSATEATPLGGQAVGGIGTITQISVKVGALTGPMKVVMMRDELQLAAWTGEGPPPSVCCTDVAESQVFTPAANSVTTLPVTLPVETGINPQTHALTIDFLGLSVLEDGVPVPAASNVHETTEPEEGEAPMEVQPETFVESPAMQTGGAPQIATTGKGLLVLLDAVLEPAPNTALSGFTTGIGGPGGATPGAGTSAPMGTLTAPTLQFYSDHPLVHIRGRALHVMLSCGRAAPCAGVVRLESAASGRVLSAHTTRERPLAKPRGQTLTYATGAFKLGAARTRAVELKLTPAGRKLVDDHKHLTAWIDVDLSSVKPALRFSRLAPLRF